MNEDVRKEIKRLLEREVVLATGCTEPGAVALSVARACELLTGRPDRIELLLSKNVFKNAMGVGIPGTGMIGLPVAVAMAVTHGKSCRGLEVLTLPQSDIDDAKNWLAGHAADINIGVKEGCDKLYIECKVNGGGHTAEAVIAKRHTNFVLLRRDDQTLLDADQGVKNADNGDCGTNIPLTARMVYEYAATAPIEELEFIKSTVEYNTAASDCGLHGMGLHTGAIIMEQACGDIVHTVVGRTVAASDARMDGCTLPVYSNSGSGNQGIACTLPPYYYGKLKGCSDEVITRALTLSHLMSVYVKRGIGRLSALCGIVNATMGVASAITYIEAHCMASASGIDHERVFCQVGYALKNMINTLAGMVCDGAKPSCALKMSTGLYSAFVCAELACHGKVVDATDGLSECDVDRSINNLGRLGHDGMNETDDMVLDIMTHKKVVRN